MEYIQLKGNYVKKQNTFETYKQKFIIKQDFLFAQTGLYLID